MNINIDKRLGQQIVNTVKDVCGYNINFIDCSGIIFASTDEKRIGTFHEIGQKAAFSKTAIEVEADSSFTGTQKGINVPIFYEHTVVAVIGISGEPKEVGKYAHLAERITNLLIREKELNAYSRTEEEKRHHIIHALISRDTLNPDYLKASLEKWKIPLDTPKRFVTLELDSRYNAANLSMMEQEIFPMFQAAEVQLYAFNYPNKYWAVMEDSTFLHKAFILERFAGNHKDFVKIAVGKAVPIFLLADSYASCLTA